MLRLNVLFWMGCLKSRRILHITISKYCSEGKLAPHHNCLTPPSSPLMAPPPLLRLAVEKDHLGSIHIKDPPQTLNGAIVVPSSKETEVRGGEEERKGKEDHVFT